MVTKKTAAKKKAAQAPVKKAAVKKAAVKKAEQAQGPKKYSGLAELWRVESGLQTVGLWVDEHVWTGNDRGECYKLDKQKGTLRGSWLLPKECVAVVSDDAWKYAGCANGCVYDLTGSVARVAYQLGRAKPRLARGQPGRALRLGPRGDGQRDRRRRLDSLAKEGQEGARSVGPAHRSRRALSRQHGGASQVRLGRSARVEQQPRRRALRRGERRRRVRHRGICDQPPQDQDRLRRSRDGQGAMEQGDREQRARLRALDRRRSRRRVPRPRGNRRVLAGVGEYVFCYDEQGALLWYAPTGCGLALQHGRRRRAPVLRLGQRNHRLRRPQRRGLDEARSRRVERAKPANRRG
jgi:hypothetical protein